MSSSHGCSPLRRSRRSGAASSSQTCLLTGMALLAWAIGGFLTTPVAQAHLSIIRQGNESAGTREEGDQMGSAITTGDFNGDGYDDVAIGAPREAIGTNLNAGSVTVNWGSQYGTTHEGAVFITAQSIGQTVRPDAEFGFALAAGDFDHDGFDDLVIGAPGDDVGAVDEAGRVYVLEGGPLGLSYRTSLTQNGAGEVAETGDRFGSSFAVGNWNGDSVPYQDLAVGSTGEDNGAGMVTTYYGSILFLTADDSFRASDFGALNGANNLFGYALASGQFIGGAAEDLAISAPNRLVGGLPAAGSVFLLIGSSTGLNVGSVPIYDAGILDLPQAGGLFGYSMSAGRLFGGAYDGLAIGEPGRNYLGATSTGRVIVLKGGLLGLGSAMRVHQLLAGGSEGDNDYFGSRVAVGYFEGGTTYADLAVGAYGEGAATGAPQAGAVYTLNGGSDGPNGTHGWAAFDQGALNEWREAGDRLGTALAFGNVDESGKGALMVGAPGNDNNTGCVHVIAPWRQTYGLECQHSVVTDCEGNLIFTQKPFDQVWIASTTKTMTVLLASERTRLPVGDPKRMSLDDEYVVPSWCAWDIPGSLVPLRSGETMTLRELMWTCLFMSGNDAAFAIADLCEGSGGPNTSVPNFIAAMNAKAAALGMNGTHFHNPAGLDNEPVGPELGEHYSTPHDMMLLSRAAMEDDLVREIVGSTEFTMTRRYAGGINVEQTFHSFFTGVLGNAIQPMNGIKGGSTPRAQATGLFSGGVPGRGDALVTTFLTPNNGTQYISDAAHLMQLGTRECDFDFTYSQSPFQVYYLGELSTCQQCIEGQALELDYGPPGDLVIDAIQTVGQQILGRLEVTHIMEGNLPNGGSVQIGIGPFQDRSEITIHNMSDTATEILFAPSAGGTAVPYQIPAQGFVTVPPFASASGLAQYTATISDIGTGRLSTPISIETTYGFEINASAATGGTPGFSTTLERDPGLFNENLSVTMFGHDPVGGTVLLAAHPNGATVDVPETEGDGPDVIDTASAVADLRVGPNPFKESSTLRFRLTQSAHVETSIYDAVGRKVRSADERDLAAGSWRLTWDGRDDRGEQVPAGVYFYRIATDGAEAATGRLVRVE